MTLEPHYVFGIVRKNPMFILWALSKGFFFAQLLPEKYEEEDRWDLVSKVYILMKRLHQNYREIMLLPSSERDTLFKMEMKLIKEEAEQSKNTSNA